MLPEWIVDTVVGVEEALDRLKLSYKERFNRFSPARVVPYRGYGRKDMLILRGRVLEEDETGFDPEPGLWTNIPEHHSPAGVGRDPGSPRPRVGTRSDWKSSRQWPRTAPGP